MTKRLSMGVLFTSLIVLMTAMSAFAERPGGKEWTGNGEIQNPLINGNLPLIFRTSAGTTWVSVGQACDPADTANSPDGQTPDKVWCFEGANGDSTWPNVPGDQNTGSKHETFDHWSLFNPPLPPGSKWHVTDRFFAAAPSLANASQQDGVINRGINTYNAWCGCDSTGANPNCSDVSFWIFQTGYGDDWNYALTLDMTSHGHNPAGGGTIQFDVRYDVECNYDYMYLEYLDDAGEWSAVEDGAAVPAVFNAISGNKDNTAGGTGRECGEDIYDHSDQKDLGAGNVIYHGNSIWLEDVTFPIPGNLDAAGLKLRWRGFSDGAWSDADGRGDTDGIGAIDNVLVNFTTGATVASDDFESGDFNSATNGTWTAGGLTGNTYDGWHLTFDPMYKNKGNTCTFSDDWMWASKPDTGSIPENGFRFYLASPVINSSGWTGAVVEYANYLCFESAREDYANSHVRVYDSNLAAWSLWNDFDGFITFAGCEFWNMNVTEDITPFLTPDIDSLQVAWETLDISQDGDFSWGKHGGVQHLVDNVSFGEFNGEATVFTARVIDIFADTFSLSDPAHTPFLQNAEQGLWTGTFGTRVFANVDSLSVEVADFNGVTEANVVLNWRHDSGGTADLSDIGSGPAWSTIPMDLSIPKVPSASDEGTYRAIIGDDLGGSQDMAPAKPDTIWVAGTTVQYYVKVRDNGGADATFPGNLDGNATAPFEFSILPLGNTTAAGKKILVIDDYTRNITDFENSAGFNPTGGAGFGAFAAAVFQQPEVMVTDALDLLFPDAANGGSNTGINSVHYPHHFDKYDVQGGGSSVQCEPRGVAKGGSGVGGYMDDFGAPRYDALIWLQGTFDEYSYADTTRLELGTYLDNGGNLLSSGDQVAFHLGAGGNDADSTIGFLGTYMGISFPSNTDEMTSSRVLNSQGTGLGVFPASGVSDANEDGLAFETGLYGECPIRRTFDRLTELEPPAAGSVNHVEMVYMNGGAGDDNRASVVYNKRTAAAANKGISVHSGWGISALLSRNNIACYLDPILSTHFAIATPGAVSCIDNGVGAPDIANGFGFGLRQASPNPFKSRTSIEFSVANRGHVSIEVYNILGQKVRTLVNETMDANSYVRDWDGRSDAGAEVSSGIYFYKMVAGDFSDTKKTVLLR